MLTLTGVAFAIGAVVVTVLGGEELPHPELEELEEGFEEEEPPHPHPELLELDVTGFELDEELEDRDEPPHPLEELLEDREEDEELPHPELEELLRLLLLPPQPELELLDPPL